MKELRLRGTKASAYSGGVPTHVLGGGGSHLNYVKDLSFHSMILLDFPNLRAEVRLLSCDPYTSLLSSAKWSVNDRNRPIEWAWHVASACHLQLLNFVCFHIHIDFVPKNKKRELNHGLTQDITPELC